MFSNVNMNDIRVRGGGCPGFLCQVPNDELVLGRQGSLLHVVLKKVRLDIMKHLQWRTHTKTYEGMCPLLILNFLN